MKSWIVFPLLFSLIIASSSLAQITVSGDTIYITGGTLANGANAGSLEATINGDTLPNGKRKDPNRVYALNEGQVYFQNAAININNPTGTLIIVGIPSSYGTTKPVWLMKPVNNIPIYINPNGISACNVVYGSIKFVNIHYQAMQMDGTMQSENFLCGTQNQLPQSLIIDNCLFEFSNTDLFHCTGFQDGLVGDLGQHNGIGGWPNGAKFRITNSYFRNLFNPGDWWWSRIFICREPIDTLWVENVTTTGAGITFCSSNTLIAFAYLNHNTFVDNMKYWILSQFYIQLYATNNIFINQSWVGEDINVTSTGQDPDYEFFSTINIDSTNAPNVPDAPNGRVLVQPIYQNGGQYTNAVSAKNMIVYVSNNINYCDPLLVNGYYYTAPGTYDSTAYPLSYNSWFPTTNHPPYPVQNIPCEWMNTRTKAMFARYSPVNGGGFIEENTLTVNPNTVTPGIADASVVDQMAKWNQFQWGDPKFPASANNITHSKYIFGDYDPTTIPGYKTENGSGITKFTDLTENFSQSSYLSTIDNLPIGSLIWNDAELAAYNSVDDFAAVRSAYAKSIGGALLHPYAASLQSVYVPNAGSGPVSLNFSSALSYDPGGTIDSVFWFVNGNLVSNQSNLTYDFPQGTNQVTLVVQDNNGKTGSSSATVTISMFRTFLNGPVLAGPSLLGNGVLYVIGTGDAVYRLDSTGNILYTLQVGGNVTSSSSIAYDTTVYIASSDKNLYAFSKYGTELWSPLAMGGALSSTPVVDSITNRLYIGVSNKNFIAVNRMTGSVSWNYFADAPIASSAAITPDRKLVFASVKGTVYGFDLTSPAVPSTPTWQISLSDSVYSSPAIDNDGYIYYCTANGEILRISMVQSQPATLDWQVQTGGQISGSPVIDGYGTLYVGASDGKLYAINTQHGNIKWTYATGAPIYSTPTVSDVNMIYFGNLAGKVCALDTGAVLHWYYQDSASVNAPLLYHNGILYVGTTNGRLVAFNDYGDSSLIAISKRSLLRNVSATQAIPVWGTFHGNNQRTGVFGGTGVTKVSEKTNSLPNAYSLLQNFPNPFNPSTTLRYGLPSRSRVRLQIYNVLGQVVADLVNTDQAAGYQSAIWNADVASGIYFYRLEAVSVNDPNKRFVDVKKMILLK